MANRNPSLILKFTSRINEDILHNHYVFSEIRIEWRKQSETRLDLLTCQDNHQLDDFFWARIDVFSSIHNLMDSCIKSFTRSARSNFMLGSTVSLRNPTNTSFSETILSPFLRTIV